MALTSSLAARRSVIYIYIFIYILYIKINTGRQWVSVYTIYSLPGLLYSSSTTSTVIVLSSILADRLGTGWKCLHYVFFIWPSPLAHLPAARLLISAVSCTASDRAIYVSFPLSAGPRWRNTHPLSTILGLCVFLHRNIPSHSPCPLPHIDL